MPNWKKVIVSGSNASLNSITASNGAIITGSLSVTNTAFIDGQLTVDNNIRITGPAGSSLLLPDGGVVSDFNTGNTRIEFYSGSMQIYANGSNEISVLSTGVRIGNTITDSHRITGSVNITGSVTLNGNQLITGSATIGAISAGASENTLTLGARDNGSEGGQLGLNAPGGTYTSASMIDNYANSFRVLTGTNASSNRMDLELSHATQNLRIFGDVIAFATSDKRLKTNIQPIENPLDKLNQISGYTFDWDDKITVHGHEGHDIGVIAQEIEEVLPEVVTTRDNGYKAVKYEKIVPLLIEAIKELKAEVDSLKSGNYNKWD